VLRTQQPQIVIKPRVDAASSIEWPWLPCQPLLVREQLRSRPSPPSSTVLNEYVRSLAAHLLSMALRHWREEDAQVGEVVDNVVPATLHHLDRCRADSMALLIQPRANW
jgi:hypothetical protein